MEKTMEVSRDTGNKYHEEHLDSENDAQVALEVVFPAIMVYIGC
jgi:hypothetical protein